MIKGAPDRSERSTVSALVERLQLSQSTVTELVQRAEDAGLVDREPSSEDARVVHLRVSPRGEQLLEAAAVEHGPERRLLAEVAASTARGR